MIDAYQEKLREVRALKNTIEVWKGKSHDQRKKIKRLERRVTELTEQLASKVCDDCGEKRLTEQMGSMSMQENKSESEVMKTSENCIDHKVKRNQNFLSCYDSCCFNDLNIKYKHCIDTTSIFLTQSSQSASEVDGGTKKRPLQVDETDNVSYICFAELVLLRTATVAM